MNFTPTDLWKAYNNFLFPYRAGRFKRFIRPEEELGKSKEKEIRKTAAPMERKGQQYFAFIQYGLFFLA